MPLWLGPDLLGFVVLGRPRAPCRHQQRQGNEQPRQPPGRRASGVIRSTQTIEVYTCPACAGYGLALEADCWNCGETLERPQRVKLTSDEKLKTTCAECAGEEVTR